MSLTFEVCSDGFWLRFSIPALVLLARVGLPSPPDSCHHFSATFRWEMCAQNGSERFCACVFTPCRFWFGRTKLWNLIRPSWLARRRSSCSRNLGSLAAAGVHTGPSWTGQKGKSWAPVRKSSWMWSLPSWSWHLRTSWLICFWDLCSCHYISHVCFQVSKHVLIWYIIWYVDKIFKIWRLAKLSISYKLSATSSTYKVEINFEFTFVMFISYFHWPSVFKLVLIVIIKYHVKNIFKNDLKKAI